MADEQNIRLLLVDDDDPFRSTLAKRLGKRSMVPEEAAGGEACLSILAQKTMDVVVLDVKMPGMDGIEVLGRIKRDYPKTEVILLTGQATAQDGVEGIKSGAFDYLSKPIELEHLVSKIRQAHEKILRETEKQKDVEFREKVARRMASAERLAALGTLAAGFAHEINNPLAIMNESVGWMRQLLEKEEMAEMPRRGDFAMALGKIEKGIERARKITHQLLSLVRKQEPVLSEVDLKTLLEEAGGLIRQEAARKKIDVILDADTGKTVIWSDPYQLRQVFINLLTNALYATSPGGKITIVAEDIGQDIGITVSDTGQGIPKENMTKIFEPFFTTKNPGEGTGLGLFVSRGIVEKLGGTIEVESELGRGSRFRVRLPKHYDINEIMDGSAGMDLLDGNRIQSKMPSRE